LEYFFKKQRAGVCYGFLMNPDIKIVSLIGRAGSGKTLMAIAAGLQQTIGMRSEHNHYSRLIVSRPVQPLGKDIGFLPGTMEEKMLPWLMPIQDNLKFLMGDRTSLEMYMEKGKIEIEALHIFAAAQLQMHL
jgi:PhoH-like ATPase